MRNIINLVLVIASLSLVVSCDFIKKQSNNEVSTNRTTTVNRTDNPVNVDQLPQEARNYIIKYMQEKEIARVKAEEDEFKVWLSTGEQLEFDIDGNIKEIECPAGIAESVIDERVLRDVKTIDSQAFIVKIEHKANGDFDVKLNSGMEIEYDANYKRIGIED